MRRLRRQPRLDTAARETARGATPRRRPVHRLHSVRLTQRAAAPRCCRWPQQSRCRRPHAREPLPSRQRSSATAAGWLRRAPAHRRAAPGAGTAAPPCRTPRRTLCPWAKYIFDRSGAAVRLSMCWRSTVPCILGIARSPHPRTVLPRLPAPFRGDGVTDAPPSSLHRFIASPPHTAARSAASLRTEPVRHLPAARIPTPVRRQSHRIAGSVASGPLSYPSRCPLPP